MHVISLVEKGWAGSRQLGIQLVAGGYSVRHVVKGRLPAELVRVITPYPGIRIRGVAPRWYRITVWTMLSRWQWSRRLRVVLVDNAKAAEWVTRWFPRLRGRLMVVQEQETGTPILYRRGGVVEPGAVLSELAA